MMRFVAIGSLRRGAINPPEPLDADGQMAAFQRLDQEMGFRECRVIWNRGFVPMVKREQEKRPARMVERMRKCGVA
jgi:hypothetical protein